MNFLKNLIGGQIVKGYSISGEPITSVGHHKQWKLYKGKKDSTGGQVSIFVLEKKALKSSTKEEIIKSAKKQVTTLAKIRHPGVLALIQPLTQDQHHLSFVTERIQGNLSSIIKQKKFDEFVSSQLQLKLSLFPLLQAINFLHEIVKLCHLGLSFEAIYVTAEGKWKIAGMNYAQVLTGEEFQLVEGNGEFWDYLHLAPEVVVDKKFNKFSDSYSLAIMFVNFMLLLKKTPHNLMQPTESRDSYAQNSKSYRQYSQFPAILQSVAPQQLIQLLSQLLIDQSTYRLTISSLESSKWINDPIVLTVKYLEKISNYQNKQQVEFLKGLAGVIDKFSGKVLHKRIIPSLTNLLKFNHLVASIIFITIDIMKRSMISVQDWRKTVWPQLKNITQGKQMTAQSLYLLISNMEVLQKFVTEESFMSSIIPLYLKCFDCPPKLKLLGLRHVQRLTKKYDYQFTKTKIVPKLVVSMKDEKIEVRKDTLKALYGIITRLDPHTIVNVVLGGMENCRKAGADPFINAITVELYNKITTNMSAQVLASKIMPGLMPYLIDPSIERQEFGMYKNALLNMMNKIEDERKKTWSQQNSATGGMTEKFTEKDFVLEKLEVDSGSGSSTNVNLGNDARFEFLNEYKNVSSSPNISTSQQQQSRQIEQNKPSNPSQSQSTLPNQQQQGNLSFGFEVPKQPALQQKPSQRQQNQPIEITFTDNSFGSQFKSSFDMSGFGVGDNAPKVEINFGNNMNQTGKQVANEWNYEPPKVENQYASNFSSKKVENDGDWNMNSFGNTNNFSMNSIQGSTPKVPQYKPVDLDFGGFGQFDNKQETKEQPFSPSTQPQINTQFTKPQMKGPMDSPGSKKLVGPGQGGLKKPPKYNEFNMPANQQQGPGNLGFSSSLDTGFSSSVNKPVQNSFDTNSFFTQPVNNSSSQPKSQGFGISAAKNDDPFAEVEGQFGYSANMNMHTNPVTPSQNQGFSFGNNMNFNVSNTQPNSSKSSDPFDDLL